MPAWIIPATAGLLAAFAGWLLLVRRMLARTRELVQKASS